MKIGPQDQVLMLSQSFLKIKEILSVDIFQYRIKHLKIPGIEALEYQRELEQPAKHVCLQTINKKGSIHQLSDRKARILKYVV